MHRFSIVCACRWHHVLAAAARPKMENLNAVVPPALPEDSGSDVEPPPLRLRLKRRRPQAAPTKTAQATFPMKALVHYRSSPSTYKVVGSVELERAQERNAARDARHGLQGLQDIPGVRSSTLLRFDLIWPIKSRKIFSAEWELDKDECRSWLHATKLTMSARVKDMLIVTKSIPTLHTILIDPVFVPKFKDGSMLAWFSPRLDEEH